MRIPAILTLALLMTAVVVPVAAQHYSVCAGETVRHEAWDDVTITSVQAGPEPQGWYFARDNLLTYRPSPGYYPEGDGDRNFNFILDGYQTQDDDTTAWRDVVYVQVRQCDSMEHRYTEHTVALGDTIRLDFYKNELVRVISVNPLPAGSYEATSGLFTFTPDAFHDFGQTFEFVLGMHDNEYHYGWILHLSIEVTRKSTFQVAISTVRQALQGQFHTVDISVERCPAHIWGFDLLVGYDEGPLTLTGAREGSVFSECGWEYFNYRFGPSGNCDDRCPAGVLNIVGIAETNNGSAHPDCFHTTTPFTLCALDFLVTDDRSYEGAFLPISFFWMDCTDNSLAIKWPDDPNQVVQGVSRQVYLRTADSTEEISDSTVGFFTYAGTSSDCFALEPGQPVPERAVDFYGGGISLLGHQCLEVSGDINLNGTPNEIADAVLFSNYFVHGIDVFELNLDGQVATSDANGNGVTLEVADLVYMIRAITGDAVPPEHLETGTVGVYFRDKVLSVDKPVAAAWVIVKGDVVPTLLAEQMDIKYAHAEGVTKILVYCMCADLVAEGQILRIDSDEIVSMEFSSYYGEPLHAHIKELPVDFQVQQNYPNPFNPGTRIQFDLPRPGEYSVTIYDILGRQLEMIRNRSEAGTVDVYWDGSGYSSGVYFYRVEYGGQVSTRKMLMLK